MTEGVFDATFKTPFNLIIAGPSQSGKSTFIFNLLKHAGDLISPPFDYIVIFSGSKENMYNELDQFLPSNTLRCVQGLPKDLDKYIQPYKAGLFIFDDLQRQASSEDNVGDIFTKRGHHENLSVCLILQNLFHEGKERLTCMRNCHYLVLFHNPLDHTISYTIAHRLDPTNKKGIVQLITSIQEEFRYILIDGKQETPQAARFRTDIFNGFQRCFRPK